MFLLFCVRKMIWPGACPGCCAFPVVKRGASQQIRSNLGAFFSFFSYCFFAFTLVRTRTCSGGNKSFYLSGLQSECRGQTCAGANKKSTLRAFGRVRISGIVVLLDAASTNLWTRDPMESSFNSIPIFKLFCFVFRKP